MGYRGLVALALVACFVSTNILCALTIMNAAATDGQSGEKAAGERGVTRWVDPEGRKPIKFSEWKAEQGPEEPLEAKEAYETPPQARLESPPAAKVFYVIVRLANWDAIADKTWRYVHDLEAEGYTVYVSLLSGGNAPGYRQWLNNKRAQTGMEGCVLIGDHSHAIPWFEMDNDFDGVHSEFPCDLFFMDLDGVWTDSDGDGLYDDHSGDVLPEIYVGRLSAETLDLGTRQGPLINNYLDKNHKYRMHEYSLTHRALVYVDDDWVPWADESNTAVGLAYGTRTFVKDEYQTTAGDYQIKLQESYEWVHVEVHSSPWAHAFKIPGGSGGSVGYTAIRTIDPSAFFYNLFACSAARYVEQDYIGGWYIFTDTRGLTALGSTKTGSMLEYEYFYRPLGEGKTLGEAFRAWWGVLGPDSDLEERRWYYGMTLLGDPTLRIIVPYFTLAVSPNTATVQQGGSTTATVTATNHDGYSRTVSLAAKGQPTGVTVSFTPAAGTPTFASTMTVTVSETAPVGSNYAINVTATGADGKVAYKILSLTITPAPPRVSVQVDRRYPTPYVPRDIMTTNIRIVNTGATVSVNFAWLAYIGGSWLPILNCPLSLPSGFDTTYPVQLKVGEWGSSTFDAAWFVFLTEPSTNRVISIDYCLWRYQPTPGTGTATAEKEPAAQVVEASRNAASKAFPY